MSKHFDKTRPLVFMHVPKSAGTSLDLSLQNALGFGSGKRFFGTVLHGHMTDQDYLSWDEKVSRHIAVGTRFMEDDSFVVAHASFQELLLRHPDGQFVTFLREPICRLISLRSFLRTFSDEMICSFGTYGMFMMRARLSLKQFLEHPYYAATCDNVVTRMLLHGHSLIPKNDFISSSNDSTIVDDASAVLEKFDFVGAVESETFVADLSQYLQHEFVLQKLNEASPAPENLRCRLEDEVDTATMTLLESLCRLDLLFWKRAMKIADDQALNQIRERTIQKCIARHSTLLRGLVAT